MDWIKFHLSHSVSFTRVPVNPILAPSTFMLRHSFSPSSCLYFYSSSTTWIASHPCQQSLPFPPPPPPRRDSSGSSSSPSSPRYSLPPSLLPRFDRLLIRVFCWELRRLDPSRSRVGGVVGGGAGASGAAVADNGAAAVAAGKMTAMTASAPRFVAPEVTLEINGEVAAMVKVDENGKFIDEVR